MSEDANHLRLEATGKCDDKTSFVAYEIPASAAVWRWGKWRILKGFLTTFFFFCWRGADFPDWNADAAPFGQTMRKAVFCLLILKK